MYGSAGSRNRGRGECLRFCVNAVPWLWPDGQGKSIFCLLPDARIVGIIRLSKTAVKAERSEFIVSLDGGRSQPYGFHPGIG
jgi:hypothetical protein